ncbi:MAG: hypothetical protein JWN50_224 [Parcubacteria group bacterium]|nr:hypothetical protein [Parcubacteria group bacterium]
MPDTFPESMEILRDRLRVERRSREKGICPSCEDETKGSRSESTGKEYPYCPKCITRATGPTDSYATYARGEDKGPFLPM